ncbi:MAG: TRAP transporter small permease subunit [Chloroflexi bacterium]|nr:TRAP transporter small permease subunit [Chloroflexota bacterium]MBP8055637.1 TRAP transporter small permease subunit [Chloroflexota bacterium]
MRFLLKYTHLIDWISEWSGHLSTGLVLITISVGFYNVVARYVGREIGVTLSSNIFIEIQWYLFSLVFFLGFAYALKHSVNVRVDFYFSHYTLKRKAWVDFIGHILFLIPFCFIGIYVTIQPVLSSWGRLPNGSYGLWELSPDPNGLPRAPIKTMIIVAFVLLLLQTIAEVIKAYAVIRGHTEVKIALAVDELKERPVE